jgi:ribA/ribD-fused uncharacterized protein
MLVKKAKKPTKTPRSEDGPVGGTSVEAAPVAAPPATAKVIQFYGLKSVYGCFSNFSRHSFTLDGHVWPTSEHYFQAMKFHTSPPDFGAVKAASGPMEAAAIGRDRSRPLRKDWEAVKDEIMFKAVEAKFTQNSSIREVLLGTGDATLVEHTPKDSYWGDGGDGSGKNMLGVTLMRLRDRLKQA